MEKRQIKISKTPREKQRKPLSLRKPARLEGKVQNVGIKPIRKKSKK